MGSSTLDTVVWAKQADVWKRIDARGVLLGRHCPDQCIGYSLGDGKMAWAYKVSYRHHGWIERFKYIIPAEMVPSGMFDA
jgi:hypothetical protein